MKRVPKAGVVGEVALREAVATELGQIIDLVRDAVRDTRRLLPDGWDFCLDSVFPDRVIVLAHGRYWSYAYTIGEDNKVALGAPQEVVVDYEPVGARVAEAAAGNSPRFSAAADASAVFIEALGDDAKAPPRYLVRIIRAGTSLNGVEYPRAVLREATPLFEGVRVFVKSDLAHIKGDESSKDFRQLVGKLTEPRFVEAGPGEIQAVLEVLESADVAPKLREAVARGMNDLFGLSIDAGGTAKKKGKFREATKLTQVSSVDLIIEPGAGGQVIRFAEAAQPKESDPMLREQMLKYIEARDAARAAALSAATDEEVMTAYREAVSASAQDARSGSGTGGGAQGSAPLTAEDVDARIRMVEARANARVAIAESKLPAPLQERLVTRFTEATSFTDADVTAAIEAERQLLVNLREGSPAITGLGDGARIEGGDRSKTVREMLDNFFDPTKPSSSFRECYIEITGDRRVSGRMDQCDTQRLREAAGAHFREAISSTTFGEILGDSITRAMIRDYASVEDYSDWRFLCDVVPVSDFRTQHRTRIGGYGNLPAVAENGPYNALTSPSDEEATYAPSKRGGTETLSLEAIANDDVGLIRRIPAMLARSAARTLYEFVYGFIDSNAAVYDTVALFHASHGNLGTAALDATSFAAARLRMKKQAEKDSNKRLGIALRHLIIPSDLEEAAYNLFVRNTNQDETFVQSRKPTTHVVAHWTDANNWYATADNRDVPLIELGFYGGEEPQLFVQDLPTQGSLFTNDQVKYKIRHIYGGAVRDYRGFDGSIVA
jgi:hypothetical protein